MQLAERLLLEVSESDEFESLLIAKLKLRFINHFLLFFNFSFIQTFKQHDTIIIIYIYIYFFFNLFVILSNP